MAAELQDSGVVAGVRLIEPDRERCMSAHGKNSEILIQNSKKKKHKKIKIEK